MKNFLWTFSLGLLLFFLLSVLVVFFIRKGVPDRVSIVPRPSEKIFKEKAISVDLKRIYENDLFRTYEKSVVVDPVLPGDEISFNLPVPPNIRSFRRLPVPEIRLVDPLEIKLQGIIIDSLNESASFVLIDNKRYNLGSVVEDGEIIKIYNNRVAFLRSSGQLETVFLTEADAKKDPIYREAEPWDDVVKNIGRNEFSVDFDALKGRFLSVSQFVESFVITSAVLDGVRVGCYIGLMEPVALGYALGFKYGDLILKVNNMDVVTSDDRLSVYNSLKKLVVDAVDGSEVVVELVRDRAKMNLRFKLKFG